jgi:NDP-sugar pyrophosphorylase family protein
MNGDVLTNIDFGDVLDQHIDSGSSLTVATYHREVHVDFGVLELNGSQIVSFTEKPIIGYEVSMGIYGLSRSTLEKYPVGQPFGLDNLVLDLIDSDSPPAYYPFGGYWRDIGRPEDYDEVNAEFDSLKSELLPVRRVPPVAQIPIRSTQHA